MVPYDTKKMESTFYNNLLALLECTLNVLNCVFDPVYQR